MNSASERAKSNSSEKISRNRQTNKKKGNKKYGRYVTISRIKNQTKLKISTDTLKYRHIETQITPPTAERLLLNIRI